MSEKISLVDIDKILPKIAEKLFDIPDISKLLKFDTSDALLKDISQKEIEEVFNQDDGNINCRIFYRPFNDKTMSEKRAEIRMYFPSINPLNNNILADIVVGFDIAVHNDMWKLDEDLMRPVKILKLLTMNLNGLDFGGGYNLVLQDKCQLAIFNDNFTGYQFRMRTKSR